jgi:UDP-N-acetylmuramoylalanine--D-glutamate ligase
MVWQPWAEKVLGKVKAVVLFGDLAPLLEKHLQTAAEPVETPAEPVEAKGPPILRTETMAAALETAAKLAEAGDVVLLSPGGTSYDAFADFEERGRAFRELVNGISD